MELWTCPCPCFYTENPNSIQFNAGSDDDDGGDEISTRFANP